MTFFFEVVMPAAVPLVLAALGGLISENAGVLNISLEGCIEAGAFTAALLAYYSASSTVAAVGAAVVGGLLGVLLATVHLGLGANLFVAGLGINLLVPSLAGLFSQIIWGRKGNILMDAAPPVWVAWSMVPLALFVGFLLLRTPFGRRIRASGASKAFLAERGIPPWRPQGLAILISSVSAALAGAFLSFRIAAYVPGMSSGRGWIALVIIWLGLRRPMGILGTAYLFALVEIFAGRAQGMVNIPASLLLAFPYVVALIALTVATISFRGKFALDKSG